MIDIDLNKTVVSTAISITTGFFSLLLLQFYTDNFVFGEIAIYTSLVAFLTIFLQMPVVNSIIYLSKEMMISKRDILLLFFLSLFITTVIATVYIAYLNAFSRVLFINSMSAIICISLNSVGSALLRIQKNTFISKFSENIVRSSVYLLLIIFYLIIYNSVTSTHIIVLHTTALIISSLVTVVLLRNVRYSTSIVHPMNKIAKNYFTYLLNPLANGSTSSLIPLLFGYYGQVELAGIFRFIERTTKVLSFPLTAINLKSGHAFKTSSNRKGTLREYEYKAKRYTFYISIPLSFFIITLNFLLVGTESFVFMTLIGLSMMNFVNLYTGPLGQYFLFSSDRSVTITTNLFFASISLLLITFLLQSNLTHLLGLLLAGNILCKSIFLKQMIRRTI
jgi:hypothetical protein